MALPHSFTSGTKAKASEVNANLEYLEDYVLPIGLNYNPVIAPIGAVIAWLKSYTNTPATLPTGWVECNGQTLSDAESPYNTQVIPNLNGASAGTQRFLRGSSTSGGTGGSETHTHSVPRDGWGVGSNASGRLLTSATVSPQSATGNNTSGSTSTLPSYYEVVWIMRIK